MLSGPDIGQLEKDAVMRALDDGWIAPTGPDVDLFEIEMAAFLSGSFAAALSSGTAALHLSLLSVGVKPGDSVVLPSMTFVASANSIVYAGARPVFVDSTQNGNIDPLLVREAIESELRLGRKVGAVLPVDLYGQMAAYDELVPLASSYEIPLVVDSAESLGASHNSKPAGTIGDISVLSFNGNKVMTTSGGGMALSNDREKIEYIRHLASQAREPATYYSHEKLGFNYRLSNILAALGRAQLERLPGMLRRRRAIRQRYIDFFARVEGASLLGGVAEGDNCWLSAIVIDSNIVNWGPEELRSYLANLGIESRRLWKPMHLQPLYRGADYHGGKVAEKLFDAGLALPSGSALKDSEIDEILTAITMFISSRS